MSPILSVHLTWQRNSVDAHIPVCVHLQSESTRQSIQTKVLGFFQITIFRFPPTPKNRLQKKSSHKSFPESMDQQPTNKSTSCVVKAVRSSVWRAETIYREPLKEGYLLKPVAALPTTTLSYGMLRKQLFETFKLNESFHIYRCIQYREEKKVLDQICTSGSTTVSSKGFCASEFTSSPDTPSDKRYPCHHQHNELHVKSVGKWRDNVCDWSFSSFQGEKDKKKKKKRV